MSEFKRQHPIATVTRLLAVVRQNLVPFIILLFLSTTQRNDYFYYVLAATLVMTFFAGIFGWWMFKFRVKDDELQIKKGVLVKSHLYLSKERIQVIDITEGLLQRMFGLVQVEIKTAGSGTESATISAISREDAEELRRELRKDSSVVSSEEADIPDDDVVEHIWKLTSRDLFYAALTSGNFGLIASILGAVSGQLDQFVTEETIAYVYKLAPGYSNVTVIVSLVAVILLLSWLLSFLGVIFRYSDFTLEKTQKELIIKSGFIERKHITIPFNRIQAVRFVEGVLRQPFGYGMIYIESAGFEKDKQGKSIVLAPYLASQDLSGFLGTFLHDFSEPEFQIKPQKKSFFRYLRKPNYLLLLIIILALFLWEYWWVLLLMIPLAAMLGYMRYKDAAIALGGDILRMRFRVLARTTSIMKRNRLQKMELTANPFQRRKRLQNFKATVASGSQGIHFEIPDLNEEDAQMAYGWATRAD